MTDTPNQASTQGTSGESAARPSPPPPPAGAHKSPRAAAGDQPARRWLLFGIQAIAAIAVLAAGVLGLWAMAASRPEPQRIEPPQTGPLVAVERVRRRTVPVVIEAFGNVEPRYRTPLAPQVDGRVEFVHESLTEGGVVRAGEVLVRIDDVDFALAVERALTNVDQAEAALQTARANVEQAEASVLTAEAGREQAQAAVERARTALALEEAEAAVQRREWQATHGDDPIPPLVAREPQLRQQQAELRSARAQLESTDATVASARAQLAAAQANVTSARSQVNAANVGLREALLNLQRTELTAPFDGRVLSENVNRGQFVSRSQTLATLYDTDALKVVVPIENNALEWFDLPSGGEARTTVADELAAGVPVTVSADYAGRQWTWQGAAVRTTGQVDPATRLIEVVVLVPAPADAAARRTLVPGLWVSVAIEGRSLEDVIRVPRHAVREGDVVWVIDNARTETVPGPEAGPTIQRLVGELRRQPVTIARADRETALISEGLDDADLIIVSSLDIVTDGMLVRLPEGTGGLSIDPPASDGPADEPASDASRPDGP